MALALRSWRQTYPGTPGPAILAEWWLQLQRDTVPKNLNDLGRHLTVSVFQVHAHLQHSLKSQRHKWGDSVCPLLGPISKQEASFFEVSKPRQEDSADEGSASSAETDHLSYNPSLSCLG